MVRSSGGVRRVAAACLFAAAFLTGPRSWAQGEERIRAFDVDIRIQPDGRLQVVERIEYDFGFTEHHGIFRDIPDRFTYDGRYDRVFPIHVVSVVGSPGTPDAYSVSHSGNELSIKIGKGNQTITGDHTYTITYEVDGALNGFRDHDELYWNAVGNAWPVPIDHASIRVTAPADLTQVACFAGPTGSSLPCTQSGMQGQTATFDQSALGSYEGLTVVVGLPRGAVPPPRPILKERWSFQRAFSVTPVTAGAAGALALLLGLGVGTLLWRTGRDRRAVGSAVDIAFATSQGGEQAVPLFEHGATPVEYAPPEGILPGQVGTLVDESANPLDVTATIVDLAVRGYLRIEEIPKKGWFGKPDWKLVRLRERDGLLPYEATLLHGLFQDGEEVNLSSLRTHFATRLRKVQDELYDDAVRRGWFTVRPDRVRKTWSTRGWLAFVTADALLVVAALYTHLAFITIPLVIGGFLLIHGARWMPRRTPQGTGMVRRVLGFRTYIETAEVDEARFAERRNLFSQYLPYAVVFGATEKWAQAFAHLGDQLPETSWYVGSHPFTAASFASQMEHFSVSTAGTLTSVPAASGGSGFGGGFSGGGGGGGGGGSW